ncbi:MAG: porin [Salinarimonadaceae bacterium]|nr:MAG: porin [Salinarimonadaceae bacterium]
MKLAKSLLLGTAAGLAVAVSVQAADLPVRKAAPVDYVRVCSAYGNGFFYIPGTETCLRVGGYVRYESRFSDTGWSVPRANQVGGVGAGVVGLNTAAPQVVRAAATFARGSGYTQFARGSVQLDARTATEYGLLRSFINGFFDSTGVNLYHAYIQFGGLTAGRISSFFRPIGGPALSGGMWVGEMPAPLIAYTATFGAFSATISAEGSRNAANRANMSALQGSQARVAGTPSMPDFVGAIAYRDPGFAVHMSAALSQVRSNNRFGPQGAFVDTKYGYALLGGLTVNLPMVGAGTSFQIQGVYASGATTYAGISQANRRFAIEDGDAFVNSAGGVSLARAWSINARLNHTWAPGISQTLYGAYGEYDAPGAVRRTWAAGTTPFNLQNDPGQYTSWQLGTVVNWSPVAGLTVSGDVNYLQTTAKRRILVAGTANAAGARYSKSDDRWTATIRIQRAF